MATATVFTDRSAFLAAASGLSAEGFEALPATNANDDDGLSVSGLTIISSPAALGVYDRPESGAHATEGVKFVLPYRLSGSFTVTFNFSSPVSAVGFDITDYEAGPTNPLVFSYPGGSFDAAIGSVNGSTEFFGIIDTTLAFSSCSLLHPLAAQGDGWGFDALAYSPVPTSVQTPRVVGPYLVQNYPNPFDPETNIAFVVPANGARIRIEIFDSRGRRVRTLLEGWTGGGSHLLPWNGRDDTDREAASGVYFCRLSSVVGADTRKIVLLR